MRSTVLFKRWERERGDDPNEYNASEKGQIVVKYFIAIIAYLSLCVSPFRLCERYFWMMQLNFICDNRKHIVFLICVVL